MNTALWVLQGLAGLAFVAAGLLKSITPKEKLAPKMGWVNDFTPGQVRLIGLAELAGGIGLVAPWATGVLPALTPVAAFCLAVIMGGAIAIHVRRKETPVPPAVLGAIVLAIAIGRSGML